MFKYKYTLHSNKQTIDCEVYVINHSTFLKLVNNWNNQQPHKYKYYVTPDQEVHNQHSQRVDYKSVDYMKSSGKAGYIDEYDITWLKFKNNQ